MLCAVCVRAELSDQSRLAIEALLRLDNPKLEQNAKLKETIHKLLGQARGTPEFVKLVEHFKVPGQEMGLLEAALRNPRGETGATAARLLLDSNATNLLEQTLLSTNLAAATNCVQALANTRTKEAIRLLTPLVSDDARPLPVRREAIKSLAQSHDGAKSILALASEQKLPEALKFGATSELHRAPWPDIRAQAEQVLPRPAALNAQALPGIAELAKMKGDVKKGERVFNSPTAGCATCHQVKGQGVDFGPNLTEIGSKLAREALYESILDPSAGISFGYEAWSIELKSGDELSGLIVSETPDELAVKTVGGSITKCKTGDVARRAKAALSIMPAGLQQNMSAQDLVDLVEYLASLKSQGAR